MYIDLYVAVLGLSLICKLFLSFNEIRRGSVIFAIPLYAGLAELFNPLEIFIFPLSNAKHGESIVIGLAPSSTSKGP